MNDMATAQKAVDVLTTQISPAQTAVNWITTQPTLGQVVQQQAGQISQQVSTGAQQVVNQATTTTTNAVMSTLSTYGIYLIIFIVILLVLWSLMEGLRSGSDNNRSTNGNGGQQNGQ